MSDGESHPSLTPPPTACVPQVFCCPYCSFLSPESEQVRAHALSQHAVQPKYRCPLCQEQLVGRPALHFHLSHLHNVVPECVERLLLAVSTGWGARQEGRQRPRCPASCVCRGERLCVGLKVEFRAGGNLRAETCPEPLLAGEEVPLGPERSCSTAGTTAGQDRQQPRPSPPWGRQKLGGRFVHRGGWSWAAHRHRCRAGGSGVAGRWWEVTGISSIAGHNCRDDLDDQSAAWAHSKPSGGWPRAPRSRARVCAQQRPSSR